MPTSSNERFKTPQALAEAGKLIAEQLRAVPFDPTDMNSPPWHPQFQFLYFSARLWRERWLWALQQIPEMDDTVRDFVQWAIGQTTPSGHLALDAARHGALPERIEWIQAAEAYAEVGTVPTSWHMLFPLDNGGVPFEGARRTLPGGVEFIPAGSLNQSGNWEPEAAFEAIRRWAPGIMSRAPVRQARAFAGWLHCRPDRPTDDAPDEPWPRRFQRAQTRLFLTLNALRLAAPGQLTAPYGMAFPEPIPRGLHAMRVFAEPPYGQVDGEQVYHVRWPCDVPLARALDVAATRLDDLLALPWLGTASLVDPGVLASPGPGVPAYIYRPAKYAPGSYLEFALLMLDASDGRRITEAVVDLWSIMEALFLSPDAGSRNSLPQVQRRAGALLGSDVRDTRKIRRAVEQFDKTRRALAHGKVRPGDPLFPSTILEYRDLVRKCLAGVVRLAANLTRQGHDASDNGMVLSTLDSQANLRHAP